MSQAYEVRLASPARRDLRSVPPRIVPAIVEFLYGELARNPKRVGKALERELEGYWSARRGPYRIIYRIDDDQLIVLVVNVDHRADVYRPR
ncbi:mRNA-degrading endonuclease RelE of RelBE toxin-antitoxin system [Nocardioides aromaticivorans]|uniref:mRNA-degrading endonuclease RelE of RelBE toxin-antitoxin system n=1 Tax=Nocardioides aromaticivorans TaxID=200618 RepID=A0A7Z0CNZ9_9ACTN|nr:type II toxin-antitoxin system RelE/ParE family toxin [Nocardioides aromaticivorans]NYI47954.1 mRNA-degrading endonuclease RelE of RelBE toxin-antitoxin system [Nocardioides aromaticivorans]